MGDIVDLRLLVLIQRDDRGAYAQFGDVVGLSKTAIHERLKKLTSNGVTTGWGAQIDPAHAGYPVVVFVRVEIDLPANREAFADHVSRLPGIQECHLTSGRWNSCLKLRAVILEQAERKIANEEE